MEEDLPYKAEYSKSNRAACRLCREKIEAGVVRLAFMSQSSAFDGKVPFWYHKDCFFKKQKPKAVGDIAKIDSLRFEDQQYIINQVENSSNGSASSKSGGKKDKKASKRKSGGKGLADFKCEYAKSNRSVCIGCEQKIVQDDIRVAKMDYETEKAIRFGGIPRWYHVDCFVECRGDNAFWDSAEDIPGFNTLTKEDKKTMNKKLPEMKPVKKEENGDEPPSKKIKSEVDDKKMKEQSKNIFKLRDNLETLKPKNLQDLLEYNQQQLPPGKDRLLDLLSDVMTFGALKKCPECKTGGIYYRNNLYHCDGKTEWANCTYKTREPERTVFNLPKKFKEEIPFLEKYKCKVGQRLIQDFERSTKSSSASVAPTAGPRVARPKPPLDRMEFVLHSAVYKGKDKDEIKKTITRLGGKLVAKVTDKTMAVISNEEGLEKAGKQMEDAENYGIQVVPKSFLDTVVNNIKVDIPELVVKMAISEWGGDPKDRVPPEETEEEKALKSLKKSGSLSDRYASGGSSKIKVQLKNGAYVDPESGLDAKGHVYRDGKEIYTAVLSKSDVSTGKNSYYKLQVIEADKKNKWWLFKAWGRIGTTVGNTKLEEYGTPQAAVDDFEDKFLEQTGNEWCSRASFKKRPGKYFMQDIDFGQDQQDKLIKLEDGNIKSCLQSPVQELMKMLFNVEAMKETMLEFELDLEKMPLGKLTQKQLRQAYTELSKLQEGAHGDKKMSPSEIIAISNKFYTMIPHSAGLESLPRLDNEQIIKNKLEMLDSLMELEVAYNLMKVKEEDKEKEKEMHPLDLQYSKLNTHITVLDRESDEFGHLQAYVRNTHAETHQQYSLDIMEVFKVERHDEKKRHKALDKWKNRHLLWHGSRVTNYPGILSQGLRIAPPEAPVTGYMFGKGIYFADMVSKSANYCCTSKKNPFGLLLLCDVALGKVAERTQADYIEKLPKTFHSVKGVGKTHPDPTETVTLPHGTKIPLGKPKSSETANTALLYNEYIVYDQSQVKIEYLLKLKYDYKY